jgi:hypothetical protein
MLHRSRSEFIKGNVLRLVVPLSRQMTSPTTRADLGGNSDARISHGTETGPLIHWPFCRMAAELPTATYTVISES